MSNLSSVVRLLFEQNFALKSGETVVIVNDIPSPDHWHSLPPTVLTDMARRTVLARSVAETARVLFPDNPVRLSLYRATAQANSEPPEEVARELARADVALAITTFSISHTDARMNACRQGTRLGTMPGALESMFAPGGVLTADYEWITALSERLVTAVSGAGEIVIRSPAGTDIRFSLSGRRALVDGGLYRTPGSWGNLPAGECFVAPLEGTANGTIAVEPEWYPSLWQPPLDEPMRIEFRDGEVRAVDGGGRAGDHLRGLLELDRSECSEAARRRRNLAEWGLGTNPNARSHESNLEMEKILGTVHLAIGDNAHIGGTVNADFHRDFVINRPTVYVDGRLLYNDGQLLLEEAASQ
ncbi:MAG: aminopeptidase [Firmicutes bacterium]|nr:aminopeptidase [Bacillota bacterium]